MAREALINSVWTNRLQMTDKKSGFLRNRFFKPTLARGSWPPESPAKPYLKVSVVSVSTKVLLKGYVYRYRNSQKTRLLSILYTGYKADYRRPIVFVVREQHAEFARFLF